MKLDPLMEKEQKRIVQVLDECFEKMKGYSMTYSNLSVFQSTRPGLLRRVLPFLNDSFNFMTNRPTGFTIFYFFVVW